MDLRQTRQWGKYLSQIGWTVLKVDHLQVYIKKIPALECSVIKIQRPPNPVPLGQINQLAKKYRALFVILEPTINQFNRSAFLKAGFNNSQMFLSHTATILIDLTKTPNQLFNSFSENARRNINKAKKHHLIIKSVFLKNTSDDQDFKKFYTLLQSLTKMRKFWIPSYGEFYKKMLSFKNNSLFLFAYPVKSDLPMAVVWIVYIKNRAWYLHTGITKDGYRTLANYLLVWQAFLTLKKMGVKIFDFEGIYDPRFPKEKKRWVNFSQFKKRFHGKMVEYPAPMIKIYHPLFKLLYLCAKIFS